MVIKTIPIIFLLLSVSASAEEGTSIDGSFRIITVEEELRTRAPINASSGSGLVTYEIPPSYTGTGFSEWIEYQIPSGYDPDGPGHPLLVGWHKYGHTCNSVSIKSQLDEECEARNWIYLAPTCHNQCHFGFPLAQFHCTKAIDYLRDEVQGLGLNIDTKRIYMAGCSMGGGAALSYVSRYTAPGPGYPAAGLILVASLYDWIHAWNAGDPGVQYWMPHWLGGTPSQVPFAYKQISGIVIDTSSSSYILHESMGQNVRHNLPVYITYANTDPHKHLIEQSEYLVKMLDDVQANYILDYQKYILDPHSWKILKTDEALDFVEQYSLDDLALESIRAVADRSTDFFWAGVKQTQGDSFSWIEGRTDGKKNTLDILAADNVAGFRIDCEWAGLTPHEDLPLTTAFPSGINTVRGLELWPVDQEPTYVVNDAGELHSEYAYDAAGQSLGLFLNPSSGVHFKVSFEPYELALSADEWVTLGQHYFIEMGGGDPFDAFLLFFAFTQKETKVQDRHLLVWPFPPTGWFFGQMNGNGEYTLPLRVERDPALAGLTIHQQCLTYDTGIKKVSCLASTLLCK